MQVTDLIEEWVETHGYPPTVRELAEAMGVAISTTQHRLRLAEKAGEIERVPGKPRAIRIRRNP